MDSTDPTVPAWAKSPTKPSYTAAEVGAVSTTEQSLTEEQKTQVRTNIGAVSIEEVEEMLNGDAEEEFSETGDPLILNLEEEKEIEVISKISRQESSNIYDSTKLTLHHTNSVAIIDVASMFGGAGAVHTSNGLTMTINDDGTATIKGTSTGSALFDAALPNPRVIYPAGDYFIPANAIMMAPRDIDGASLGNKWGGSTYNINKSFVLTRLFINYGANKTVDETIPINISLANATPDTDAPYTNNEYTVDFGKAVVEGEYNWTTGELKDADGNIVSYHNKQQIIGTAGTNVLWTGFGEITASNKSDDNLDKVVILLNEAAPEETVPSICDFTLTPATKNYSINLAGDSRNFFRPNGNLFYGMEVPLVTTRGKFIVTNSNGLDEYELTIPELINYKDITDVMTCDSIIKRWSKRFYITRDPDFTETVDNGSGNTTTNPNTIATWIFSKKEFEKYGLPVEVNDIPIVSPVFTNATNDKLTSSSRSYAHTYLGAFSYDAENGNYVFKCRARQFTPKAIYKWTSGYFCYPLKEEVYLDDNMISLYLSAGYSVRFEQDDAFDVFLEYALTQGWSPFVNDSGTALWNPNTKPVDVSAASPLIDTTPHVGIFVPRSVEDALYEAEHIAKRLNHKTEQTDEYEVNSYSWIGDGDGTTDYTEKIQSKLTEVHNTANGGTIYLGTGTYPISGSLIVYDNTRIIGDGQTVIEQTADNTHAIILSGSNITIKDLAVKLSGACTDLTACMYINSNNHPNVPELYDSAFPENMYAQNITVESVQMIGTYSFEKVDGYDIVSDDYENYMGVGIYSNKLYYNYAHIDNVHFKFLMAGVYGGGGSNYYNIMSEFNKYGLHINSAGDNTYFVGGHSYYSTDKNGDYITMSDAIAHVESDTGSTYHLRTYDTQAYNTLIFLGTSTSSNKIDVQHAMTNSHSLWSSHFWDVMKWYVIDYGRGNMYNDIYKHTPFHIGSYTNTIGKAPQFELSNPVIQNVLSGAGVWGNISSNIEFVNRGISLSDVCRYPSEKTVRSIWLPCILSTVSPTEDNPIEIVIDYSNRPVIGIPNYFIQFDSNYIASDYTVHFDITNTGVFDEEYVIPVTGNTNVVEYFDYPQISKSFISYRMKICFTKPLQIDNLKMGMLNEYFDYNPDGLIGICNIGMTVNDYAGRSFLGECGGSLYGNVDMHQNTLKNLPAPVDDGDAVSKSYLEERLAALWSTVPNAEEAEF